MGFELVEFREPPPVPGKPFPGTREALLATFGSEEEAIAAGREAWETFRASDTTRDVAWWIVRLPGESLARWIADSGSDIERVLDLTTNQLVEIR